MGELDTLKSDKNPAFAFCEAEYYIAYRDGKPVGRIAAIINKRANETWNLKSVRFGWFDFIDDIEVSTALINKVKEYGRARGLENIIGPLGFTDMDREGMQVSGFDYLASMHSNHNFAYYPEHMEKIGGFTKENDWIQLEIKVPETVPEKFAKISSMIEKRYNLRARKMTKKELIEGGLGKKFFDILNTCYSHLYNYSRLDDAQVDDLIKNYISLADLNLITIVVDDNKDGEMVGFGVSFPSFSEALKKTKNGKLLPFGWYHLLKALKFHNTKTVDLLLCGVLPEYRAKGANSLIFNDLIQWYQKYGFEKALALPMMETNEGVLGQWQYLDSREVMRLRSYTAKL
jgi:GNAT superfamily N-acetyltransferase